MLPRLARLLLATYVVWFCSVALAADTPQPVAPPPADASSLPLPKGATVAIVVFEDLQCPDCAQAHPQLLAAAEANKVPLVIHDFPIPRHVWAFPAAIVARYFTLQSPALGVEFRSYIFEHQKDITPDNLREYAEKFAQQHGVQLPAEIDPDGKLAAQVQADFDLGKQIGLHYVPLMFVIGRGTGSAHYTEVMDPAEFGAVIARMR
ncbi:MAG: thioredoxin domain-containing protein [Steroidobacteraceae bacterium]